MAQHIYYYYGRAERALESQYQSLSLGAKEVEGGWGWEGLLRPWDKWLLQPPDAVMKEDERCGCWLDVDAVGVSLVKGQGHSLVHDVVGEHFVGKRKRPYFLLSGFSTDSYIIYFMM